MSGTTQMREVKIIPNRKRGQPQKRIYRRNQGPHFLTVLLSIVALLLAAHFFIVLHMNGSTPSVSTCSSLLRTTDYTQLVRLNAKTQEMGAIQLVPQLVGGQSAALVQVNGTDDQHLLDVYIYGCDSQQNSPKLIPLFVQRGLAQGTVEVSAANTLITSAFDSLQSADVSTPLGPLQQNIYREYLWHNGTFVQIAFPSLYPVTSRGEAELLQQQADSGQPLPWNDPLLCAQQMTKDILKWTSDDPRDTVVSNDGSTAQVLLYQNAPHLTLTVKLQRLLQHDGTGVWFVVNAQTEGISLTQPQISPESQYIDPVTSPLTLQGGGALSSGQTTVTLFDHTFTPVPVLSGGTLSVDTQGDFTGTLLYTNTLPDQPGLLLIQSLPQDNTGSTPGQLLLTRLILA